MRDDAAAQRIENTTTGGALRRARILQSEAQTNDRYTGKVVAQFADQLSIIWEQ